MSIKFSNAASPRTLVRIPVATATTLPNADWTLAVAVTLDGSLTTGNQYLFSGGSFGSAGSVSLLFNGAGSETQVFLEGAGPSANCKFTAVAGATYIFVLQRSAGVLRSKVCPQQATMPTTGAAVLTGVNPLALTKELVLPGFSGYVHIGDRNADRPADQSLSRMFVVHEALSDLDIAKLAFGMQITDLGKTPAWNIRMTDGSDTADIGPNALATTRSPSPMATGAAANWSYVTTNRPPTVAAPTIEGSPLVGSTSVATLGAIDASPAANLAFQWLVAGVPGTGEGSTTLNYTPVSADLNKALTFRVIASNSEGTTPAISEPKTIGAAVVAIDVAPPVGNTIFQRVSGARVVPFTMTYSGEQPAKIEYRLTDPDGTTERKAWADMAAVIAAGGTATASPSVAQGAKKYRVQVRGLRSNGTVIATSAVHANRFGVGDLLGNIGSSSAESWAAGNSTGFFDAELASQYRFGGWQTSERTHATRMATYIAQQLGVVVGIVAAGVGGTSIIDWAKTNRLNCWSNFADTIALLGGKLAGVFISVGSNDAAGGGVVSQADHLANIELLIGKCRTATGQSALPILMSGFNRRLAYSSGLITAAQFEAQANMVRMAENQSGDLPNVFHVQALQFEMQPDQVHLTGAGYVGLTTMMGYVWVEAMQGRYRRGPKILSFTWQGNRVRAALQHRSGTDITPTSGYTGLTLTDGAEAVTFTTERQSASAFDLVASRALTAPVVKYMSGGGPDSTTPVYDNGAVPLPTHVETEMPTVAGQLAAPDTTAPTLTGAVTSTAVTATSATIAWPLATDDVAVTGYEYSTNGGTSYVNAGTARTAALSGLTASTTYQLRARAYDAAGNRSSAVSGTLTTLAAADTTAPLFPTGSAISTTNISQTSANITWPVATDNTAVTGYEYSVNGAGYVSTGTARTAALAGLASGTQATVAVRAIDGAGNRSSALTGVFTTLAETPGPEEPSFARSKSRTINIAAAPGSFEQEGKFWTFPTAKRPTGSIDPNATIDITFNWTAVLTDISDTIAAIQFDIVGLTNKGGFQDGAFATIFVSNATGTPSITCRITTASTPPRVEDRTVYLNVEQQ